MALIRVAWALGAVLVVASCEGSPSVDGNADAGPTSQPDSGTADRRPECRAVCRHIYRDCGARFRSASGPVDEATCERSCVNGAFDGDEECLTLAYCTTEHIGQCLGGPLAASVSAQCEPCFEMALGRLDDCTATVDSCLRRNDNGLAPEGPMCHRDWAGCAKGRFDSAERCFADCGQPLRAQRTACVGACMEVFGLCKASIFDSYNACTGCDDDGTCDDMCRVSNTVAADMGCLAQRDGCLTNCS